VSGYLRRPHRPAAQTQPPGRITANRFRPSAESSVCAPHYRRVGTAARLTAACLSPTPLPLRHRRDLPPAGRPVPL